MNDDWTAIFYGLAMFWVGYYYAYVEIGFIIPIIAWGIILLWFKILEIREKEVKKK